MFDLNRAIALNPDVLAAVDDLFGYHDWNDEKKEASARVRAAYTELAKVIIANVPPCPDRSDAIRSVRSAAFFCNSAITHGGNH
jgi:hypothetical protein